VAKILVLMLVLLSSATIFPVNHSNNNDLTNQHVTTFASTVIWVPENCTSIQEAINAANPGDTIYVDNGTYYENIYINKTVALVGKDPETTIIDGSKSHSTYSPTISLSGEDAKNVILRNFTIQGSSNAWGIYIFVSPNSTIANNIVSNNHGGVIVDASSNNTFINNTVTSNLYEGMFLFQSSGNIINNNTISGNAYNFGIFESAFDNDIDESNLINGKPTYYLVNQTSITINPTTYPEIGYLALINCSDITIENLNLTNNYNGILLAQTNNTKLTNSTFASNVMGISIYASANITLQGNNITSNWQGITLTSSPNNTLKQNNLTANQQHLIITGTQLNHFLQDIDTSNTVDRELVRYVTNQTDLVITPCTFPNTGYLALVNCQNVTVQTFSMQDNILLVAYSKNSTITQNAITKGGISLQYSTYINVSFNELTSGDRAILASNSDNNSIAMNNVTLNSEYGILLESSNGNTVMGNSIAESTTGISLDASANNSIIGNNITANKEYGTLLTNSNHNTIYHNNFIDNAVPRWQAVCGNVPSIADNVWDNGYPSGGNFWNDYNGTDQHSGTKQNTGDPDAIGDTPYVINFAQKDNYPLAGEFHDFTVNTTQAYDVEVISNSSIANLTGVFWLSSPTPYLQPGQLFLWLFVSGETNTTGFCRVTIPRDLLNGTYVVLVDWQPVPAAILTESNSTHAYLYFTYGQSEHELIIIPEYSTITLLLITAIAITTVTAITVKKRNNPGRKRFHSNRQCLC